MGNWAKKKDKKIYVIKRNNVWGNQNTGSRKKELYNIGFLISIYKFFKAFTMGIPHFILQDQIEIIDNNQMINFFEYIMSKIKCPNIASILEKKFFHDKKTNFLKK